MIVKKGQWYTYCCDEDLLQADQTGEHPDYCRAWDTKEKALKSLSPYVTFHLKVNADSPVITMTAENECDGPSDWEDVTPERTRWAKFKDLIISYLKEL